MILLPIGLLFVWVVLVVAVACGAFGPLYPWIRRRNQRAMVFHCNHAVVWAWDHGFITDAEWDGIAAMADWRRMFPLLRHDPGMRGYHPAATGDTVILETKETV